MIFVPRSIQIPARLVQARLVQANRREHLGLKTRAHPHAYYRAIILRD